MVNVFNRLSAPHRLRCRERLATPISCFLSDPSFLTRRIGWKSARKITVHQSENGALRRRHFVTAYRSGARRVRTLLIEDEPI